MYNKWIKLSDEKPYDLSDNILFLVSDGKEVWMAHTDHNEIYIDSEYTENIYLIEGRLTHWCMLTGIDLPDLDNDLGTEDFNPTSYETIFKHDPTDDEIREELRESIERLKSKQ